MFIPVVIPAGELGTFGREATEGELPDVLGRISTRFTPSLSEMRGLLQQIESTAPLASRIPVGSMADGQFVAPTGSVDDDPDGRLRIEIIKKVAIDEPWLRAATDALLNLRAISADQLRDYLEMSPLLERDHLDLVLHGLPAANPGTSSATSATVE
jgi:hypothetical protein